MDKIQEQKKNLRNRIKELKTNLTKEDIEKKSSIISSSLLELEAFEKAKVIMCYLSFGNEVDTRQIIEECLKQGKQILVPLIIKNTDGTTHMEASELIDPDNDLEPRTMGILEPKESAIRIKNPKIIDLVVIPGLAFDRRGNRLGYGAGYYDYFLKRLRPDCHQIAITFSTQIVEQIPTEEHDLPITNILTEKGLNQF